VWPPGQSRKAQLWEATLSLHSGWVGPPAQPMGFFFFFFHPNGSQDYRLVALTPHIMKTLERLVLEQLRPMVRPFTDLLQFTYQPCMGVEDGIIYLLNRAYTHLDKPASTVRGMFFDFSSAFNTICPSLLGEKLTAMQVEAPYRVLDC